MDYNINFQDNIRYSEFNQRAKGVLDWIMENREKEEWAKDPNAYELTNIYLFAGKYAGEKQQINTDSLKEMWNIRSQDFERCGVSNNSFIYKICEDSYLSAMEGKALVNDENSHHALRRMAGIGLYLKQQQRDGNEINYNNPSEIMQLMECSRTLKTFHPDLFEKYRFETNIENILKLQLKHELPKGVIEEMNNLKTELKKDNLAQETNFKEQEQEDIIE